MDTIVSRTLSVHKEHEVLLKLEAAGLCDELAQKVVDSKDNDLAKKVVRLIQNGGFEPSTSQKRAREIMGKNIFGVEEAIAHFGVNPSKQQTAYLAEVPFAESALEACTKEKGEVGWQLIRKTPVSDSMSKTWEEQNKLLGKDEEVPSARAVVYAMVGHYKAQNERLFEKVWVRCSDLDSDGYRVSVGDFDAEGLHVDDYWDDFRRDDL